MATLNAAAAGHQRRTNLRSRQWSELSAGVSALQGLQKSIVESLDSDLEFESIDETLSADTALTAAFRSVFDLAPVAMLITTGTGKIEYINRAFEDLLGYNIESLHDPNTIITHPDDLAINAQIRSLLEKTPATAVSREKRYIRQDGKIVHAILSIAAEQDQDGKIIRLYAQITDVTQQKENEEQIRVLSCEDSLTGLFNRRAFLENCESLLKAAKNTEPHIVLFMDLNRFKTVNDSLGHRAGDNYLHKIARKIVDGVPSNAVCGRLGGDEFAILIPGGQERVADHVERLQNRFLEPIEVFDIYLSASFSIGVSVFPDHGTDLEHLIACADTAMYQAKTAKVAYQVFDGNLDALNAKWLKLEPRLRKSIQAESFNYAYQNIYKVSDGELQVEMREALIRWAYRGESIPPDDFIPLAEETGLIRDIDRASVRCTARDWKKQRDKCQRYTVNVSALTLCDDGFLEFLDRNIAHGLLQPEFTVLEITETAVLSSAEQLLQNLEFIRNRGFGLAIDDFGAGQTSIGLLSHIPADYIKLDRKLASNLGLGGIEETIVRSLIDIAHGLNMAVICEGVETQIQLNWLTKMKCDYLQGYLLHKPTIIDFS